MNSRSIRKPAFVLLSLSCLVLCSPFAEARDDRSTPSELNKNVPLNKPAGKFGPKRTTPVFKGAWSVGMVLVAFPDTRMPPVDEVKKRLFHFGPMTVSEYFKEYSQGIAWPELAIVGEKDFPKSVYTAPNPIGYYCEYDHWSNPLGYKDAGEGNARADQLRTALLRSFLLRISRP